MHFENSYNIWSIKKMYMMISEYTTNPKEDMNRTFPGMYIEWWLHNIGYYITKPFCFIKYFNFINLRCKDVDLEEWIK